MGLLSRPPGPPADVIARAGLPRGERPLTSASTHDGWLVGTRSRLVLVGDDVVSLPWELVESADWDEESQTLTVAEVGDFGSVRPVHRLVLDAPSALLQLVRERVTASIVLQRRERGFLVVGRRNPSGGEVRWLVEYDAGVDPSDPAVERAADDAVRRARSEVGD